jgi:pilus assembly protein FimV
MRRQFTVAFGLVGALASMSASALGLGTIRIDSRLNQPFAAEIPLLSVSAEQLETVRVRLADADEFRRLGIERADYLSELRFELLPGAAPVIRVSSARPARDPFLTFLLDVRTDTRRVLREYTVLLDPPPDAVSRGTAPAGPAPITAPAPLPLPPRAEAQPLPTPTSRPPATPLPVPESTPRPAVVVSEGLTPAADAPPAVAGDTGSRYGPIQPQETLWSIANAVRPETASVNQTLLALYTANPGAFDRGRFDGLLRGVTLTVPPAAVITSVDPITARDRVLALRQGGGAAAAARPAESAPRATPPPTPRPTLPPTPPPTPQPTVAASPSPAFETEAEDDDGAAALTATEGEVLDETASWDEDERLTETTPVEDAETPALSDAGAAAATAQTAAPAVPTAPPRGGLVDALLLPLLLVLAALLGGLAWWWARRRRAAVTERLPPAAAPAPKAVARPVAAAATAAAATPAAAAPSAQKLADEAEAAVMAAFAAETQAATASAADEEAPPSGFQLGALDAPAKPAVEPEAAENLDATQIFQTPLVSTAKAIPDTPEFSATGQFQVDAVHMDLGNQDPAAEADIHMAYGLYDEAELTLNSALAKEPQRPEWLFKLAEVQFAAGRGLAFTETAERARPHLAAADWQKLALLGRQIAPENPLFAGADDAAAMAAEVDLVFDAPAAEPARDEALSPASLNLDMAELDVADLGTALEPEALEFNLDDFEVEELPAAERPKAAKAAAAAPAADTAAMLDFDLELSPVSSPAGSGPAAPEAAEPDPGNRLEFSLDDFDMPAAETAPAVAAPGPASSADRGEAIDFKLDSFDLDDSDTISSGDEAATKLDLARAYVDMGDTDMAQALLNEVLSEGSAQQQAEARELIARMG